MTVEDLIVDIKTDFRTRRIHYPCATIVTPIDKKSHISRRVMPFMWKLVCELASKCLLASEALLSQGQWSKEKLQVVINSNFA